MGIVVPPNGRGPVLGLALPASVRPVRIKVSNDTTGKSLTIALPAAWDGTDLSLDFYRRTIKDAAGTDRSALLDVEDNDLWLGGAAFPNGSAVTIGVGDLDASFLPTAATLTHIAVDAAHLYWVDEVGSCIGRAKLDGSEVQPEFIKTTAAGLPQGIAVNATFIYWSDMTGAIGRAKLDGSEVKKEFITAPTSPGGLTLDGTYIYWAERSGGGSIGRVKLAGTEPAPEFITAPSGPSGVAVDGSFVYWTDSSLGAIGRAKLAGTEPAPEFITAPSAPSAVAVDAAHIYWSDSLPKTAGAIGRAKLAGTAVEAEFIPGPAGSSAFFGAVVDADYLYWANRHTKTIGRALKPIAYALKASLRWEKGYF